MFAKTKVVLALAMFAATGVAQATVTGATSASSNLIVGTATAGTVGMAGAGVVGQLESKITSFDHYALAPFKNAVNSSYSFSGKGLAAMGAPATHSGLGVWTFAKVGSNDVWFGEWDAEGTTTGSKVAGTHTAFYVGENGAVATTLPTTGPVTYAVKSINRGISATAALPSSTLTANFSTKTASSTGDIAFTGGTITTSASDVKLAASGVSVASVSGTGGALKGNFYGTGASSVAGVVSFTDRNKDTAFGGTKN
ncbi:Slam-dependent surface lipoprotein [Pseudomonas graminis]